MGYPSHKMALQAETVLSGASLGQEGKSLGTRWVFAMGCEGDVSDETPVCEGKPAPGIGGLSVVLACTKPWGQSRGSSEQGCSMQLRSILQLMLTCTLRAEQ